MLCKCSTGLVPLMKKLIERMPDVVVVGDERSITLLRYTQCGLPHVSRNVFKVMIQRGNGITRFPCQVLLRRLYFFLEFNLLRKVICISLKLI